MNVKTHHTYAIGDDETMTQAIVRAVSAVRGKQPERMQPLGESIDAEAIDSLFTRFSEDDSGAESLSIIYEGCRIEVSEDTVVVKEIPSI